MEETESEADRRSGGRVWDGRNERRTETPKQKWQRVLFIIWIILFTGTVMWMYVQNRERSKEGLRAHDALCIFKHDLQVRADSTEQFLKDHPQGFAGIPVTVLRTSLANQRATIDSLKSLNCQPPLPGGG